MKWKSMSAHGNSTLAWVCRWSSGLPSALRPAIHILAGLKVCIHAIRPITRSSSLARRTILRIESESASTGFHTIRTGTEGADPSTEAMAVDCAATWRSVSAP
jgi:hypothetical protein